VSTPSGELPFGLYDYTPVVDYNFGRVPSSLAPAAPAPTDTLEWEVLHPRNGFLTVTDFCDDFAGPATRDLRMAAYYMNGSVKTTEGWGYVELSFPVDGSVRTFEFHASEYRMAETDHTSSSQTLLSPHLGTRTFLLYSNMTPAFRRGTRCSSALDKIVRSLPTRS
jgi:hypothetical protein